MYRIAIVGKLTNNLLLLRIFLFSGDAAKSIVSVETLACTKFNSMCQANVVLRRRLDAGRYYDFRVQVRDTRGGSATISCSISATNSTTPKDTIFPHIPGLIMVAEVRNQTAFFVILMRL